MHLPDKQPDQLTDIANKLRAMVEQLLAGLAPCGEPQQLTKTDDVFARQPATRLLLLQSGQVQSRHRGKLVYIAEAGDLLGLSRSLQLAGCQLAVEDAVTLLPFERDQLIDHVNSDPQRQRLWTYYLLCLAEFYRHGMAHETRGHFQPVTGFQQFASGDTIIRQGDEADLVFTMLEGEADAIHDGVKVGEIHSDEIFGAMAVFTRQPRSASVIATSDCSVMAVRKEDFVDLIEQQPGIGLGLIEEMANKINQLNNKVSNLQ